MRGIRRSAEEGKEEEERRTEELVEEGILVLLNCDSNHRNEFVESKFANVFGSFVESEVSPSSFPPSSSFPSTSPRATSPTFAASFVCRRFPVLMIETEVFGNKDE